MNFESDYRLVLREEFLSRRLRNPRYSLRAFARDLSLSASTLSEVLSKHHNLSLKKAESVTRALGLSRERAASFLRAVGSAASETFDLETAPMNAPPVPGTAWHVIDEDRFRVIADWYHLAILEATKLAEFRPDVDWLARRFGLDRATMEQGVKRLKNLKLLAVRGGEWVANHSAVIAGRGVPSAIIRQFHQQMLALAQASVEGQPQSQRELQAAVVATDADGVEYARNEMRRFVRQLGEEMARRPIKDRTYCISMQLFRADDCDGATANNNSRLS